MTHSLAGRAAPTRQFSRLAQCIAAICAASGALPVMRAHAADNMDEIVVTATRRSESVSDVPYNISAVGASDIRDAGVTDLQGLTHMIPGLVSPDSGSPRQQHQRQFHHSRLECQQRQRRGSNDRGALGVHVRR
jgi:outer membrane receptor protein involved in Fe transport